MPTPPYPITLHTPRLTLYLFSPSNPTHYTSLLSIYNSPFVISRQGDLHLRTKEDIDVKCAACRPSRKICTRLKEGAEPPSHPYFLIFLKEDGQKEEEVKEGECIREVSLLHRKPPAGPPFPDLGWALRDEVYMKVTATRPKPRPLC
jgi:hypothetical protein